jgi:hypothetical protein
MESAIVQILRNQAGIFFCDACLALKAEMSLQEAQEAVGRLDHRSQEFTIVQGQCSECLRTKIVVAAVGRSRPARIA